MIRKLYNLFRCEIKQLRMWHCMKGNPDIHTFDNLKTTPLTTEEREEVQAYWSQLPLPKLGGIRQYRIPSRGFEIFKTLEYFDKRWIVPETMYPRIILALEDPDFERALVHKFGYSTYLSSLPQPKNIVRCIDGLYFGDPDGDDMDRCIDKSQAIELLANHGKFIIKKTIDSYQGRSIQMIDPSTSGWEETLDSYDGNFVCQDVIQQSETMAKLHRQSINTLRIVSLFINGKLSICEAIVRVGQADAIVDNAGAGGFMVGMDLEGNLRDYGYDHFGNRHYDNNEGVAFKGYQIPQVKKAIEMIEKFHPLYFPTMGVVAWDWAIDTDENPVFVEANLGSLVCYPDIMTSQLAVGHPFFGERTDEVIDFVRSHESRILDGVEI